MLAIHFIIRNGVHCSCISQRGAKGQNRVLLLLRFTATGATTIAFVSPSFGCGSFGTIFRPISLQNLFIQKTYHIIIVFSVRARQTVQLLILFDVKSETFLVLIHSFPLQFAPLSSNSCWYSGNNCTDVFGFPEVPDILLSYRTDNPVESCSADFLGPMEV